MATQKDIEFHYDEDPRVFEAILGPTMIYSCANWEKAEDLQAAQQAKVRKLLGFAEAANSRSFLDIGCGWGGVLRLAAESMRDATRLDGITISPSQARYASHWLSADPRVRILQGDFFETARWAAERYDSALSIGAFEHFASPRLHASGAHLERYRQFFHLVRECVKGPFGLQTIVAVRSMDTMNPAERKELFRFLLFISKHIFPNSLIPRPEDLEASTAGIYRIDRFDMEHVNYDRTLQAWKRNLEANQARLPAQAFERFRKFFDLGSLQFQARNLGLAQLRLVPI